MESPPTPTHSDLAECIANVHRRVSAIEKEVKPARRRLDKIEKTLAGNQTRFDKIESVLEKLGKATEPLPEMSATVAEMHEILKLKQTAEAIGRAGSWTAKALRGMAGVAASIGIIVGAIVGAMVSIKIWAKGVFLP